MNRPSNILSEFVNERARILEKQAKQNNTTETVKNGAKGVSVLGSLMPNKSEMSLSEIIDKRPGKKEVEKYFRARCVELCEE